jgi:hypothetical protein
MAGPDRVGPSRTSGRRGCLRLTDRAARVSTLAAAALFCVLLPARPVLVGADDPDATRALPPLEYDALGRARDDGHPNPDFLFENVKHLENLDLYLPAVPDEAARLMPLPAGVIKSSVPRARAAEGTAAHGAPRGNVCTEDESAAFECGEDAWYHKNPVGGFNRLLFNTTTNDTEWVLDDASLPEAIEGCSLSVGYVTDSTELVRVKVRIFQPGFDPGCPPPGQPPDMTQPANYEFEWCAPGSPDGSLFFNVTVFEPEGPVELDAGPFAYQITVQSTEQNADLTGLPLTSPGTNVLGTANLNGNSDCFYSCASQASCDGPFSIGAYAGFHFAIQSTARRSFAPHGIRRGETFSPDCDLIGDTAPPIADSGPFAGLPVCHPDGGDGDVDSFDRAALKTLLDEHFGSTGPFPPELACIDVDGNGVLDHGDWEAFLICLRSNTGEYNTNIGTSNTTQGIISTIDQTNSPSNYVFDRALYRYLRFTSGGGALNIPESTADLPLNVPDNNASGFAHAGRIIRDATTAAPPGPNGVADVNVDLNLRNISNEPDEYANFFNGDYVITFVHVGITTTLVTRPFNGTTGNSPDKGYFVVFDDGEDDLVANSTAPAQFARSNFQVFGRYRPQQPLAAYIGRAWGGAFQAGHGPGAWRVRVRDLDAGGSGTIVSWGIRARLGPVITAFIPSGDDYTRTLGCQPIGEADGTYYTFGHPSGVDPLNFIPAIDADFFDPGSEPYEGSVAFEGRPIVSAIGDFDLVLGRISAVNLNPDGTGAGTGVVVRQMNLVSCQPLTIAYKDRDWDELWNAQMNLGPDSLNVLGAITLYHTGDIETSASGLYWQRLRFRPIITFRKACDPLVERRLELASDDFVEMSTGTEEDGNPTGNGCSDCRFPYVNDPDRLGNALGSNPNGVVQPDQDAGMQGVQVNFAPNVTPGPDFDVAKAEYDGYNRALHLSNLNWARHTIRAATALPSCPVAPLEEKALPSGDLIVGTWGFGPFFPRIAEADQPFLGIRPGGTDPLRYSTTSENKPGFQHWTFAAFRIPRTVMLGRAEWWGACGSPGSSTEVIDYPNDEIEDVFTLRIYRNRAGTGTSPDNPPLPDVDGLVAERFLGDADRRRTGAFQPNNSAPEYFYTKAFSGVLLQQGVSPEDIWWVTIFNNTETVLPDVGEPDTSFSRWRWTATADFLGEQWDRFFVDLRDFTALNTNRAMRLFEISTDFSKLYCGDSVAPSACSGTKSGLSYLVTGNPGGSGDVLINGDEETSDLNFPRNRWVNVRAPFKNHGYDYRKFDEGVEADDPLVREELEDLIAASGKDPQDWQCEIDALLASLPTGALVDHVFGG